MRLPPPRRAAPVAAIVLAVWVLLPTAAAASLDHQVQAGPLNPHKPLPIPPAATPTAPSVAERLPGETMEDAIVIPSLPFADTGNTCPYADDYAVMCPYGNWAPDIVYAFTPEIETNISISLCDSHYDTALFLYHTNSSVYNLLACNDDWCGPDGYRSAIEQAHVVPGLTYYIVVDGYTSACGEFILQVDDIGPCIPECTAIWEPEGEQDCAHEYFDDFNSGCETYLHAFRSIAPSTHLIRICGSSGWYYEGGHPTTDSDWYEIQVEQPGLIDVFCQPEFNCALSLLDGRNGCYQVETLDYDEGYWCESMAAVSAELAEGTYWILVEFESGMASCGLDYRLWIDGYVPDPMSVAEDAEPSGIRLHTPVPNPSVGPVEIGYALPQQGFVRMAIHDIGGRLVRRLMGEIAPSGSGRVVWDGKDDAGRETTSGVYECRVSSPYGTAVRPFLRLR